MHANSPAVRAEMAVYYTVQHATQPCALQHNTT